ncbi:MAG: hypothetical protein V8R82_00290 [Clostridia bacterium]|jgi:hypothetical protein
MNNFVKMDVAIELLADKISRTSRKFIETKDMKYEDELNYLFNERDKMYNGDVNIIDKIINVYGPELKLDIKDIKN